MKKQVLAFLCVILAFTIKAQNCCDVIDSETTNVTTSNGLCVITSKMIGASCFSDTDGDGLTDDIDKCPEVAGLEEFEGCPPPDTDKDGVIDSKDACPTVYGTINGCPDSDGDGIIDKNDACPKVKGTLAGCPDADKDGIKDSADECPYVAGPKATKGCPDTDGDGIVDKNDKCPTEAGIAKNKGCPEVDEETTSVLIEALKGVQFESGKDVIRVSSYPVLNKVVNVMTKHPEFGLKISGHTDSQGNDDLNLDLSKRRAHAVETYLINNGVEADRLNADGYGETVPVADNGTAAGRAKNRRVEFDIEY